MSETWQGVDLLSSGLYVAEVETWMWGDLLPGALLRPGLQMFTWSMWPDYVEALRDANATAGTWPDVITLEHRAAIVSPDFPRGVVVPYTPTDITDGLWTGEALVPVFVGDVEQRAWRRRKWWGRGPLLGFYPYGRPRFGPMLFIPYAFRTIETVIGAAYKASLDDGSGTTKGDT